MRWRASRSQPFPVIVGQGPADNATVVIGTDGQASSWEAFRWACREARRLGGRAVVVLIGPAARLGVETDGLAVPGHLALELAATEEARQLLCEMVREAGELELTFIEARGDPVGVLLRVARDVHADLVVVGGAARYRFAGAVGARLAARRREAVIAVVPSGRD